MDSAQSEKIVLEIATNLNTRFLVLPLRSETVGDVRGPIKSYHMDLFPTWGEVDINALEVERSGVKYRLPDCLSIRELFWGAPQGKFFAELIPSTTKPIELPRLNIAGATGANVVSNHELHQNPAESTPSPRRRLAEGQIVPNLGASSDKKSDLDRKIVVGRHGHGSKPEVVERQLRTMKRGSDERDCPSDAGERQVQAECATADVRKPATKKICVDRGHPFLEHIEPETGVFTENRSFRKTMLVVESTTRPASCGKPENGEQLQLRKLSLPESCQHSPLSKAVHEIALSLPEPVEKDVVGNSARALYMGELNRNEVARSETGHPNAANLPAEPGLGSSKALDDLVRDTIKSMKKEVLSSSSDMSVSGSESETRTGSQNGIASGKQTDLVEIVLSTPEKRVPSGGPPNLNGISEEVETKSRQSERLESEKSSGSSSGGSSDETSEQNEDSPNIVPELPGDYKSSSSDGSSAESEGEEGSEPVSPREGSVGNDSDQTSSDGDSSQPSSAVSESENIESSSDDSEGSDQTPPTGRKMDFTTPKDGSGAARSIGRRSLGGSKDPKYQHLRENQNGSDELINLSQRKSIVISGSQQELQPPAEAHDSLAPVSLADDSHPNDLVQDKEVGDLNECAISDEQQIATTSEAVEKKKDAKPTQENVTVRRSVRQKDKRTAASVQDGGKGEERSHGRSGPPTSVKLGEAPLLLSVREELIPSGEGITENGLEPGEEPPSQARSGDSQKIRGVLQLARMSATNGVDSNVESPSKKRTRRKKGISSEATPVTQAKTLYEESSQQEPHIRGESVDLLPEGDDQRLEANLLLSPDQVMAGAEGLGNVLRAPEATEEINKLGSTNADENQIGATEKIASDSDFGTKKQRKRSNKFCESNTEVTQQDIRGYMKSEPSLGLDRPKNASDEAGNKGTSGKTPRKRKLATNHEAVENVVLGLQQDGVPNSLNKNARELAEEKMAGQLSSRWVCTICNPSLSYTKRATLTRHLLRVHNLEKDGIPSELLQQVECQREGQEEVEKTSQLHVAVNQKASAMGGKRQLEDTEPPILGSEDLSQRASIDDEIKKEGRRVAGPVKEFGSQESAEVQLNGEPTQNQERRRKLSVEFSEDPSRLKKSRKGKKDRDSNQDPIRDHSALMSQEVDLVSDKELQGQETEQAGRLVLEEKHSNVDEENEADEEYTAAENEKKDSKRVRKSSKSSKKARNLETPLMTDENIGTGGNAAEDVTIPFESASVELAEADFPLELPENLQGQHSNVVQKKKRKKSKNLDPSVEGTEEQQVELVDDEDQIATHESQEGLTPANLQNGNDKGDKKSRKEKLQQLGFLRKDGVSLRKDSNSKKSGNGKFAKSQQITFSGGNLPGKSKAKKSAEGSTGTSSKRKTEARTKPEKPAKQDCPYGCGKEHNHKTSAYYRHLKACPLAPGPQIA